MKEASVINRHCAKRCTDAQNLHKENLRLRQQVAQIGASYTRALALLEQSLEDNRSLFQAWQRAEAEARQDRLEQMDLPVPEDSETRDAQQMASLRREGE